MIEETTTGGSRGFSKKVRPSKFERVLSFDITQVVGTVELSPDGTELPPVEAMRIICANDQAGTFKFDDGVYRFSVEMERSDTPPDHSEEA